MRPEKAGFSKMTRNSLLRTHATWPESPDPLPITSLWGLPRRTFFSATVSMRSIPDGPSAGAGKARPSFGRRGSLWAGIVSGRRCARWGSRGIHPGPNLSKRALAHKIYPYLLRPIKPQYQPFGASISPRSGCFAGGSTLWPSLIAIPALSSHGNSIAPWNCLLFSRVWTGPLKWPFRTSGTAIREAISPATAIWTVLNPAISRSAWMEKDEPRITSSQNTSGEASNGKRFISTNTTLPVSLENESTPGSRSTTTRGLINPWNTGPFWKSFRRGQRTGVQPCKTSLKPRRNYSSNQNLLCLKNERLCLDKVTHLTLPGTISDELFRFLLTVRAFAVS